MEKYGTYKVYKHKTTGDILRVLIDSEEFQKVAEDMNAWIELKDDPDVDSTASND